MRVQYVVLPLMIAVLPFRADACSCFGPSTFCETLYPHYEPPMDPAWWTPDAIVLGVKMASVAHGMDILVLQGYLGEPVADDVIRVWGDTGLLCRLYADSWDVGDTVVWALRFTDQLGGSMEQSEDFLISACGVYWLDHTNGVISGPLYTEGATEYLPVADLGDLVNGCLSTGLEEVARPEVSVRCSNEQLTVSTSGAWSAQKEVSVIDPSGRTLLDARFLGTQAILPLQRRITGLLLVRVTDGQRSMTSRVVAE